MTTCSFKALTLLASIFGARTLCLVVFNPRMKLFIIMARFRQRFNVHWDFFATYRYVLLNNRPRRWSLSSPNGIFLNSFSHQIKLCSIKYCWPNYPNAMLLQLQPIILESHVPFKLQGSHNVRVNRLDHSNVAKSELHRICTIFIIYIRGIILMI